MSHLNQVVAETQQTLATVQKLTPPSNVKNAHALLVAALDMRYAGAEALRQAVTTAQRYSLQACHQILTPDQGPCA